MSERSRERTLELPAENRDYDEKPSVCHRCVDCSMCVAEFQSGRSRHFFAATASSAGGADAFVDRQLALLRKDIRSVKKQLIAANLTLSDDEAAKFWLVYDQYSTELSKINDARTAIIKEYGDAYGSLTDEQADSLIRRWLDTDIAASALRQKYVPILRKVLPGKKAATFFQLGRRVSMMINLQLTSQLPLVQSQD